MSLAHYIDKARGALNTFSQWLGEGTGMSLESHTARKNAQTALHMDLPSLRALLPYETCDEQGFFINKSTRGFGLHIAPCAGADESLVKSLAALFADKLPAGVDCTVLMYRHPYVAGQLAQTYAPIIEKGGIYAELAKMSLNYHQRAIHQGYPNARNVPAVLADYRCYLFVSAHHHVTDIHHLRASFESELKASGFGFARLEQEDFCTLITSLLSPNPKACDWPEVRQQGELIRDHVACPSSAYEVNATSMDVSVADSQGIIQKTRIVNCHISALPQDEFALWQTPDLFANLLRAEHGIHCPFLISMTIRGVNQERMKAKAKSRAGSLNANNNAVQNFINPGLQDEAREWRIVHGETSKGNWTLMPVFYNIMLFTDEAHEREHVAKVMASYRQQGFTLMQSRCRQLLRFLGSLPFTMNEGLFSSLSLMGMTEEMNQYNIANLLPIVADVKGSRSGLLLPTCRHQFFCLDAFDERALPITNFNHLTVASTGAGKSLFEQAQILDGLSRGQMIFVIDIGGSYKHLCELVGGSYIDASTLALNPFTLFDFEGVTEIDGEQVNNYVQIRDLLAIMANPNEALLEIQRDWLLEAVQEAWKKRGRHACIDDVMNALQSQLLLPESLDDQRLKDVLIHLKKYASHGLYGARFNAQTPLLNGSNFVVLEMGKLQEDPNLLKIVMFTMIVIIQGQFYNSDRRIQKRCIIDEAWRFLTEGSNATAAQFIAQGFRTARKHMGGFSVITQSLLDTQATIQGKAIIASSDVKIIMRQGNFQDYVTEHPKSFSPLQVEMISAFGEAKTQGFSNIMLQCNNRTSFHRFFCDPFTRVLFSTSGDEVGALKELMESGMSLIDAVNQVSQKYQLEDNACA